MCVCDVRVSGMCVGYGVWYVCDKCVRVCVVCGVCLCVYVICVVYRGFVYGVCVECCVCVVYIVCFVYLYMWYICRVCSYFILTFTSW